MECFLAVKIIPNAKKNEIIGWVNDELKIRIAAVPEKGNANEEMIRFLAQHLHLSKDKFILIRGQTNRHKLLKILGFSRDKLKLLTNIISLEK